MESNCSTYAASGSRSFIKCYKIHDLEGYDEGWVHHGHSAFLPRQVHYVIYANTLPSKTVLYCSEIVLLY